MNERRQDFEWLQRFTRGGEQAAFADVVRRHLDLVFATALRKVADPGAAQEVADLTYVWTEERWLYLAAILDLWSRRVVGWATAETLHASLAARALAMAIQHRRPPQGLLHHSGRGVQYASSEYRGRLEAAGLEASMSRAGNPYDNATMGSFNATYKREWVGLAQERGGYATRAAATPDFFNYAEKYYNPVRRHSALGYQTPVDFENQLN